MEHWLQKPLVRSVLFMTFGFVMFIVFLVITFPDKRVKQILVVQIESALDNKYDVKVVDIGLWRLTGVQLKGLSLTERLSPESVAAATAAEAGGGPPAPIPTSIRVESVSARLAPLASAINLGPSVSYRIDLGGGLLHGSYKQNKKRRNITLDVDEFDLRKTPAVAALLGMPVFGVLNGDMSLELHPTRPIVTAGHVDLDGKQLTVGPATVFTDKFPPMSYFEIPQTNFGTLSARIKVENGVADKSRGKDVEGEDGESAPNKGGAEPSLVVNEFKTSGRDLRTEIWGDVAMSSTMAQSRPKIEMRLQFDESFVTKNSLAPILNMKEFRNGKNNSWYGFVLWGTMKRLRFKGATSAAQGPQPEAATK